MSGPPDGRTAASALGPAPVPTAGRAALTGRPQDVAPRLLGSLLVTGEGADRVVVRVDEVEAYAGPSQDPGSHADRGRRPRNATMFGRPGLLYVYFSYGMHWCVNVVAHPDGSAGEGESAGAVLLRSGEVVEGLEVASSRRSAVRADRDLARGPARLAQALGLNGDDDGTDLLDPDARVRLLPGRVPPQVAQGPRVGVAGDGAPTPWRWWDARSGHVSAYRAAQPRARRESPSTPG